MFLAYFIYVKIKYHFPLNNISVKQTLEISHSGLD